MVRFIFYVSLLDIFTLFFFTSRDIKDGVISMNKMQSLVFLATISSKNQATISREIRKNQFASTRQIYYSIYEVSILTL